MINIKNEEAMWKHAHPIFFGCRNKENVKDFKIHPLLEQVSKVGWKGVASERSGTC